MRIHYLQHVPFENPAMLVTWAHERGHRLTGTHLYNFEAVPEPDQFDWLVIMGGPMNIYEEKQYPWLGYEKDCIRKAIEQDKVVLGICLGAQLIADVLGGKVTKNPVAEIGWLPVTLYKEKIQGKFFDGFPESFPVFQWHNDTFSMLGEESVCIASSEGCPHQAFMYRDRVFGFQFHLESTAASINSLLYHCADELRPGPYVQTAQAIRENMGILAVVNSLMTEFLDRLAAYTANER